MSELRDKTDLLLNLVPIGVVSPEEDVQSHSQGLPDQLYGTIVHIRFTILLLDSSQSDVQETNSRGHADQRDEKDRVQSNQMRESNRVQELNLDQWVLGVDIEVNVDHAIEDYNEAKNHDVRPNRLDFSDDEDGRK